MGEVGDAGYWLPADASKSNRASSNSYDAGAEVNKCGICSTEVVNRGVLDCCAHWFCFACIDDWATVTNLCPLCKARFRFITCLPVGYGDSSDPDNIGAGFSKRVDGSADDEGNFPFSFPSYFIDEEAVVCLEGDACRVRAGLPSLEADGALAADTSVACDVCDCWYHAGCVNFDPEQSSFYCPRCIALQEKPKNSWHDTVESGTRISSEARASTLVGLLPPAEKELSYGGGTVLGSTSVAIAVAEKGESAVSLSMRRIPVHSSAPQHRDSFKASREESKEVMWSPIREPVKAPKNYGPPIWSPIRDPMNVASQDYNLWSPTPGPVDQDENDEELWSPTPESERASCSIFKDQPIIAPVLALDNSIALTDSMKHDTIVSEVLTSIVDAEPHVSKLSSAATRGSDSCSVEVESHTYVAPKTGPSKKPEDFSSSVGGTKKDEKILIEGDSVHGSTAVEQLKKGKRRAVQEDERRIDSNDLPEPPRKVARKFSKKTNPPEGRSLAVGKDSLNKTLAEENVGDNPENHPTKDQSSIVVKDTSKEVPIEEIATEQLVDDHQPEYVNQADNERTPEGDGKSHVDVMDIVSDSRKHLATETGARSTNQTGVRTRIIMHRETDAEDTVGSGLVDRIRQQMRATAGYTGGDDLSKVEISDDRFLAAFKAALLSSREKAKETKSAASRPGNPLWLAKIMNRKNQVKGSRESLTKKLYGGGTGRWDRDWDISFWRERSAHLRKSQKEAEDEIKSLGMITGKRSIGDDMQTEEKDPIFSRIYVADTSLFPRNDDVQLLSAQGKNSEDGGGKRAVKAPLLSLDKGRLQRSVSINSAKTQGSRITSTPTSNDGSLQGKGSPLGVSSKTNVGLGGKLRPSPKSSTKSGSMQPQASETSVALPTKSTTVQGDAKEDKRQWALEVLARKKGTSSISSSSTQTGSAKTTEYPDNRDGQFSLLVQLPVEMRPLLQHNRHSKVPTAVRQVQLNRMVEQELRRAELQAIGNSPECEEAVQRAKAREEELCKKSNSKGVYVNLCVRSLAQTDAVAKVVQQEPEVDHSDAIQKALEATGLAESPPTSPSHGQGDDCSLAASTSKAAIIPPSKESGDKPPDSREDEWVDNVLEMGNLDIYGDFELNIDNYLEDPILSERFPSSQPEAPIASQDSASETKRMTVVLASTSNAAPEPAKALPVAPLGTTPEPKEMAQDSGTKLDSLPALEVSIQVRPQIEDRELEGKLTSVPSITDMVVTPKNPSVHAVSLAVHPKEDPHLSPSKEDLKKSTSRTSDGLEKTVQPLSDLKATQSTPAPPVIQNMDDWMNSGKFADLDRRIENIRHSTSPSVNREIDVPWSSSRTNVELASQNDLLTPQQSVQKQVEIYVNQHLKPLYRSGVINSDQFRYTVSKTAAKVMEHHENATSADFLIVEGSKVKKLADQYLQNYTKRKVK